VALVSYLGWWRVIGFNASSQWRQLALYLLPAAIIILPPFLGGLKPLNGSTLLYLTFGYLLTGFTEESLNRGIQLRVLEPAGRKKAVIISAILFGLTHLTNVMVRANPAIVMAQAMGSFCDGFAFAVLRFRTNTIWFLIALHAVHDLLLQWRQIPAIPLDVAQVTLLLIYGIYLMQGGNLEEA
jgi:uncharacterized protein